MSEAYTALHLLRLWEEQQKDGDSSVLSFLNKYEQRIRERRMRESQQRPITAFFGANKKMYIKCQENRVVAIFAV
jgi:hypothetical protein